LGLHAFALHKSLWLLLCSVGAQLGVTFHSQQHLNVFSCLFALLKQHFRIITVAWVYILLQL
jgi:hypothetical protein